MLSYMNYVTPPGVRGRVPRRYDLERLPLGLDWEFSSTSLSDEDLQKYGWTRIRADPSAMRPGDVVTAADLGAQRTGAHLNSHSGIVIQSGKRVTVRQKPNPFACVTDCSRE